MTTKAPTRAALMAATGVAAMMLAGCAGSGSSTETTTPTSSVSGTPADPALAPVKVGYISQEKELLSVAEARVAAEAGTKYVNAERGGIGGHPMKLETCLAGDSAESAIACATKFVNDDSIDLVITATYSDPSVLEVTSKAGLPTITTQSSPDDWKIPHAWAFDAGVSELAYGAAEFLKGKGVKTAVMLCGNDPGLLELCEGFKPMAAEQGIEIRGITPLSFDQADYTGAVTASGVTDVDAAIVLVDRSQCVPVAQSLSSLAPGRLVLSFDACLRPETLQGGVVNGWYEMVGSPLATSGSDPAVAEGQRILSTYSDDEPYPYGFAPYGLASSIGASEILTDVGFDGLSREAVDKTLGTYVSDFGWYAPVSCPGPSPFPGACVRQVSVNQAEGDQLIDAGQIDVDVTQFAG